MIQRKRHSDGNPSESSVESEPTANAKSSAFPDGLRKCYQELLGTGCVHAESARYSYSIDKLFEPNEHRLRPALQFDMLSMLARLKAATSLDKHWRSLEADILKATKSPIRGKGIDANLRLLSLDSSNIILHALDVAHSLSKHIPAKILRAELSKAKSLAKQLAMQLHYLEAIGVPVRSLMPAEENIGPDTDFKRTQDGPNALYESDDPYLFAKMLCARNLREYVRGRSGASDNGSDASAELTQVARRIVVDVLGDPNSLISTLLILSEKVTARAGTRIKRHNDSGSKRIAQLMAEDLVRLAREYFGNPRYERAAAIAGAATGVQLSAHNLRVGMESDEKEPIRNRPAKK